MIIIYLLAETAEKCNFEREINRKQSKFGGIICIKQSKCIIHKNFVHFFLFCGILKRYYGTGSDSAEIYAANGLTVTAEIYANQIREGGYIWIKNMTF